ncbi:hypothetical protein [Priestia flexa]|uniref:hypothetical protein n=1 Tax=Priestia flexa TaxID=86664 RepID=UPI002492EB66|nr:hypothetical protein [Priestia flexa]
MGALQHVFTKYLGKVIIITTKDNKNLIIRLTKVNYQHYKVFGVDQEGMKLIIEMKDILYIKEKRPSRWQANEDLR